MACFFYHLLFWVQWLLLVLFWYWSIFRLLLDWKRWLVLLYKLSIYRMHSLKSMYFHVLVFMWMSNCENLDGRKIDLCANLVATNIHTLYAIINDSNLLGKMGIFGVKCFLNRISHCYYTSLDFISLSLPRSISLSL